VPLVLAGAPIGQAGDASPRLAEALATAELVAAEDTRRLHRLCADLGVTLTGQLVSYFEGNEAQRTPQLLDALRAGSRVVLVTDAGMPTVSDPGYRLVAAAAEEGLPVTCVPGPSAVTTALAVSGLPTDRFCFEGFLPRKAGERRARLAELQAEPRTCVLFEAPHRLADALADMAAVLGPDPPRRRLPRADQDLRGGRPRHPARAGRLGRRRRARRGHPGPRGRPGRTEQLTPTSWSARSRPRAGRPHPQGGPRRGGVGDRPAAQRRLRRRRRRQAPSAARRRGAAR
jgi:16S rRNA (cytidine1402-2'-O)-methyltransferase